MPCRLPVASLITLFTFYCDGPMGKERKGTEKIRCWVTGWGFLTAVIQFLCQIKAEKNSWNFWTGQKTIQATFKYLEN